LSGALNNTSDYRPEIDGLRAIAVVVVVLFHAKFPGFTGGFVGVDIFFVLSGYLITGILWNEANKSERISLLGFYARRGRRLLPAVFVVLIATMIASQFFLPADGERQALAASAVAATLFVSNFYFWRNTSGYFGEAAEELPLLHTWTLSVEEQFYLVWPVVIIAALFISRNREVNFRKLLLGSAIVLSTLSFLASLWLLEGQPSAAFYLAPARAFELGAGAILALLIGTRTNHLAGMELVNSALIIVGFIAVGYAIFFLDGTLAWPGWLSLIPVLGTVALLTGLTLKSGGFAHRVLSVSPMVWIGKLSYSWYLWHWPFLVYVHIYAPTAPSIWQITAAVVLSFFAAAASFRWIEDPIRRKRVKLFSSRNGALVGSGAILALGVFASGVLIWKAEGELASSKNLQAIKEAKSATFLWDPECNHYQYKFDSLADWRRCRLDNQANNLPNKNKVPSGSIILWGDSHAHALLPTIQKLANLENVAAVGRVRGGCRPFNGQYAHVGQEVAGRIECEAFNSAVVESFPELRAAGFSRLIIASRWPPAGEPINGNDSWSTELYAQVEKAKLAGFSVSIMVDVPNFDYSVPKCMARFGVAHCDDLTDNPLRHLERQNVEMGKVVEAAGVEVFDPLPYLCPDKECMLALKDGTVLYKDDNHLSVAGAEWLAGKLSLSGISIAAGPE